MLIMSLRLRMVTELYLASTHSNISVFATASDAATHSLKLTVLSDCIAYMDLFHYQDALKKLRTKLGADIMRTTEVVRKVEPETEEKEEVIGTETLIRFNPILRKHILNLTTYYYIYIKILIKRGLRHTAVGWQSLYSGSRDAVGWQSLYSSSYVAVGCQFLYTVSLDTLAVVLL